MKRILMTLLIACVSIVQVFASTADGSDAVSMESYEQSWLDSYGTIALKNNTADDIHNVTFMLEYLDTNGKPMDYETYSYEIDIAPGMTKKLDIPAYEPLRRYHYYKTKDGFGNPSFKLRYELKDFNAKTDDTTTFGGVDIKNRSNNEATFSIIIILMLLLVLGIYAGMYVLVAVMAQKRGRNPVLWLLLSFIITPLLVCIILLALGYSNRCEY